MNLVPFPAHRHDGRSDDSVPRSAAPRFERLLADRLAREFPGETFSVYPDWEQQNVIILTAPRSLPPRTTLEFDGGRVLGFELRVRTIVDRLLRSEEWRGADDRDH